MLTKLQFPKLSGILENDKSSNCNLEIYESHLVYRNSRCNWVDGISEFITE